MHAFGFLSFGQYGHGSGPDARPLGHRRPDPAHRGGYGRHRHAVRDPLQLAEEAATLDYNLHILDSFAPALGWRRNSEGPVEANPV